MEFYITEEAWNTILGFASIAYEKDKNEVSGLCVARLNKDGDYVLDEPEILLQENTGTTTELDADACAEFYAKKGMKYQSEAINGTLRYVWWHSHHTMGAFWSGTDENEIKEWKNSSFSMALVVNLKEDYKFRVSQWQPLEAHKDLPLTILRDHNWTITKDMEKQYEELCSEKTKVLPMNRQANIWNGNWNYLHKSHNKTEISNLFDNTPRILALEQIKKVPNDAMVMNEIKEELLSEVEDLHNNYTTAQLDFKTYKTHIDTLNKLLISKKAGMTVKKYNSHKKLVEAIAKNHSHEFIKYKDKATEVAYENAEEISIYNQGYFH
tara:strand:- start:3615 stop:4586 length:972 start_codon:yes stop_codon:yes gene_type:complete